MLSAVLPKHNLTKRKKVYENYKSKQNLLHTAPLSVNNVSDTARPNATKIIPIP